MCTSSGRPVSIARTCVDVPGADRLDQTLDGDAVDVRLQLRPTLEPIRPREHQLGVVQRERARIGIAVMRVHFRDGVGSPAAKRVQQFLRLALELIEVRMLAQRASGRCCASP